MESSDSHDEPIALERSQDAPPINHAMSTHRQTPTLLDATDPYEETLYDPAVSVSFRETLDYASPAIIDVDPVPVVPVQSVKPPPLIIAEAAPVTVPILSAQAPQSVWTPDDVHDADDGGIAIFDAEVVDADDAAEIADDAGIADSADVVDADIAINHFSNTGRVDNGLVVDFSEIPHFSATDTITDSIAGDNIGDEVDGGINGDMPDDIGADVPDEPVNLHDEEDFEYYLTGGLTADESILREDPFAFRERSWDGWRRVRKTTFVLLALAAMLVVAIGGGSFALNYLRRATQNIDVAAPTPTISSYSGGVVIQPDPENIAPTPVIPIYQIGVWSATNSPSGGSVKVFVRLTHNVAPVANVAVTLSVEVPGGTLRFGPTKTDAYGLAAFNVTFGGARGSPVFVTATAKISSKEYSAQTVFVPI